MTREGSAIKTLLGATICRS